MYVFSVDTVNRGSNSAPVEVSEESRGGRRAGCAPTRLPVHQKDWEISISLNFG